MDVIASLISLIKLAAGAAPAAKQVYEDAKTIFAALFAGKQITAEQQDALMKWSDAHQAATLAGQVPPEFVVE